MSGRSTIAVLLLAAATSCGARNDAANQGGSQVQNATIARLALTSMDFQDGHAIPPENTCDGANVPPRLRWSDPPQGTKSFALIVDDPDAPGGTFRHWGIYDIPATITYIGDQDIASSVAINGFGKPGYGGPCPPKGHGPHHYHFKLYALDTASLDVPANSKVEEVDAAAQRHAIARGELVGTYERK